MPRVGRPASRYAWTAPPGCEAKPAHRQGEAHRDDVGRHRDQAGAPRDESAVAAHALFPGVLAAFARAAAAPQEVWRPELVTPAQGALLAEIAEAILPETETPGAKAARVHVFIDLALARCVAPAQQQAVLAAIDALGADFLLCRRPSGSRALNGWCRTRSACCES